MKTNLALAEAPQFDNQAAQDFRPHPALYLVPEQQELEAARFVSADSIPELFVERQRAAQEATSILARNSHLLHNGRAQEVPTAVDALGTARPVVEAKQEFGVDSPEYTELFEGLELDSGRLLGEAATKNTKEYFARQKRTFEPETGEYFSHGLSITNMTRNALTPLAEAEDQDRRIVEHIEEDGTYVPIGNMIANVGLQGFVEQLPIKVERDALEVSVEVTTMSRCAAYAKRDFAINPKGSHGGYRPEMDGMAIRRTHFEDDSGDREEEHVIISGIYITHEVIEEVLVEEGIIEPDQNLTTTELLGTQIISVNDGGLMGFVEKLDKKAGEVHGLNLFMGDKVPDDHPKDYYEFMEEAEERRKRLAPMPTQLAEFLVELEEKGTDSRLAEALVNKFLKTKLLARAKKNPELAEAMFDKATAEGFAEVARLDALGRTSEARSLELEVVENAPEVSYCSGGGCAELEDVDPSSPAGIMAQKLGLKGKMVRNKEAACKKCKTKNLHHDYHNNTVCTSCRSTKLHGKGVQDGKNEQKSDK